MHILELKDTVKNRRESLNLTQEMLADLTSVSLRTIKQIESGKGNPQLSTLLKIGDVLGLSLEYKVKTIAS